MPDSNVEIARLQSEIATYLGLSQDHLIFSFKQKDNVIRLDLITINPKHDQSFLFNTTKAVDKIEALKKMMDYVKVHYKTEETYTIQWVKIGEDSLHTSYFRAKNIYDVLDKFYYERDLNSYRIYSVALNPIS
jgi:hypothetical protein